MRRQTRNQKPEMRNQGNDGGHQFVIRISDLIRRSGFGFLIFAVLIASCTGSPQSRQDLNSGKQALDSGQNDDAIRDADAVISSNDAPALAEAYYIRGYAIETRPKPDNAAATRDFGMARESYTRGLNCDPRPAIAGRLHVQLGNVCYYQEDYSAAIPELNAAFNLLDVSQPRDLVLYHIGICEQRLGRFEDADRTFLRVQQNYSASAYAAPAKAHQGIRGFYVQLGAYSQPRDIEAAARAVAAAGSAPLKVSEKGLTVIRTADVPSYGQAQQLREHLARQYPDARVMP